MSNTKLNQTRSLIVIPSDDCNIPSTNLLTKGTGACDYSNIFTDASANFFITNASGNREYVVNTGDVIYVYEIRFAATIVRVIDEHTLELNADFGTTPYAYNIYQEGAQTGLGNEGCLLYIGGLFNADYQIGLTTIGYDYIHITKIPIGILPIQVKKVWKTNTEIQYNQIIALW